MTLTFLERLAARSAAVGSVLCLGLDPDPATLPRSFTPDVRGSEAFCRLLIEAAGPYAAALKANIAFFEAFGSEGLAALERLRQFVPEGLPVIVDAKRGDIGSTTARQAVALFDRLAADAVTVNPYLGESAIAPLLERGDRFAYVLCRTSNPGAGEVQDLIVAADADSQAPDEPLWARLARRATGWGPGGTVGLVVGATAPAELAMTRTIAPGLAFLVPGVGAQGGDVTPVLAHGRATAGPAARLPGGGLLVNVSRGIAGAADPAVGDPSRAADGPSRADPGERLAASAAAWSRLLPVLS